MAINTLATATLFMTQLDKIAVQEATTGWMDANAGRVIYNGGSEVKIPKMDVQGMGDYDRENGYQRGSVTLAYETKTMTQDRGRLFQLDPMDVNETNFVATASAVMGEFQRTQVVPEIDAYRISKLATETLTANKAGMIGESYVPGAASTSALRKLKEGIKAVRENYNGALDLPGDTGFYNGAGAGTCRQDYSGNIFKRWYSDTGTGCRRSTDHPYTVKPYVHCHQD